MKKNKLPSSAQELDQILKSAGDPSDAGPMKKYMKDHFEFYGIRATERRQILKDYFNDHTYPEDWRSFVRESWAMDGRESLILAMEVVYKLRKKIRKEDIDILEFMITQKSWWDSVDFIASNIIGYYFFTYPEVIEEVTSRWVRSDNMWLNRTCLLFQLKYREYTNFKLLQQFIHLHKYSNEFFIQKAIGWALRQYAKTNPKDVRAFVAECELKKLSRREALKHFS